MLQKINKKKTYQNFRETVKIADTIYEVAAVFAVFHIWLVSYIVVIL